MKTLKKGETSRKETLTPKGSDIVTCHAASAHPSLDKGARFQHNWGFDFSKCSEELRDRAAAEYCLIAKRREFVKVSKPKDADWDNVVFPAQDLIPEPSSKADKMVAKLAAFSKAELADMGIVLTEKK